MNTAAFRASQICKTVFILENIAVAENVSEHTGLVIYAIKQYEWSPVCFGLC